MPHQTGAISGQLLGLDRATPRRGYATATPDVEGPIKDRAGNVVMSGELSADVADDGTFMLVLPASDDGSLDPSGFSYSVRVTEYNAEPYTVHGIWVPAGQVVRWADVVDAAPRSPSYALQVQREEFDALAAQVAEVGAGVPVDLTAEDVGADPAGAAVAAVAEHLEAADPHGDRAWTTAQIQVALDGLINAAPGTLDTLGEIAAQLAADESAVAALTDAINGKVPSTRKVNGKPLSSDVTVTKGDLGLGNVNDTPDAAKPVSGPQRVALDVVTRSARASRGKVVFIVDDALVTQRDIAMPKIESVGGRLNFAIPWSSIGQSSATMVAADVTAIYQRGHQIMCHSMTHPNMVSQGAAQRQAEWDTSKANLEAITAPGAITDFVYPNNASDLTTQREAYGRYLRCFTAQNAPTLFAPGENGLHIGRNTWGAGAAHAQALAQVRRIAVTGEVYVLFCHDVVTAGTSSINQAMLNELVDLATSLGVQFVRADEALVGHAPIVDPGFESGDISLHQVTVRSGASVVDIVDDAPMTGLSGSKSLRIVGDGSGQNVVTLGGMGIFVPRVEEYTVSGRIHQDKVSGAGGGYLLVRQWDEFGNNLGDSNTTPINTAGTGVTAWAQYTATVTVDKRCRTMSVRAIQSPMVGTTWFDHVHIAPTRLGVLG